MSIDITDTPAHQAVPFDEEQYLVIGGDRNSRKILQQGQNRFAVLQIATGEFADDKRMRQRPAGVQQFHQRRLTGAQVVNPNRTINQDHAGSDRRRGTGRNPGSVPPNFANRPALSLSINALTPSRTSAVFSFTPLTRCALARSSSSMFSVVLIGLPSTGMRCLKQASIDD